MAELNLKQIKDKLNNEFTGESRKLVFWYDDNAEFVEDVDEMELVNAKVLHLAQDNQFYTKYFLECVDTTTNYLVYAPFAKPALRENHLADTIRYSKEFFADRASLLTLDLGIDERCKPIIQEYIKFFGEKRRMQAFYDLELEVYNRNTIEVGLMSILCKCKVPVFEEVLRTVLIDGEFEENPYLAEFQKFNLLDAFWRQVEENFGYTDAEPTLEKLTMALFTTYMAKDYGDDLPKSWQPFVTFKQGNVAVFLDNLMYNELHGENFDDLSKAMFTALNAEAELKKLDIHLINRCHIFAGAEELLIQWMIQRLELEDTAAKAGDMTMPELIKTRRQGHFGKQYRAAYFVLENAWHIIANVKYHHYNSLQALIDGYTTDLYQMDRRYRYFYYYLDQMEDASAFENLKERIENIYTNEYLTKVCNNWNQLLPDGVQDLQTAKQSSFYSSNVKYAKDQIVVIISDALRYETGATLLETLQADEKNTTTIKPTLSVLPSTTKFGMAALLPHRSLEITDSYGVLADGKKVDTLDQRQALLQEYKFAGRCVQYDDIKGLSVADLRNIFARQEVVYVYHNQIDARGDKLSTENEVFKACEEAIEEISALVRRLTTSANRSHFFITADHGFIYKRSKLTESDKIGNVAGKYAEVGKRYFLADEPLCEDGVSSVGVDALMGNHGSQVVSFPVGADIFKTPGAGINYVHGGSSPQEMIVPLIEVKTEKGKKETTTAQIAIVSLTTKLTNLIASLDFVQTEPVSDVVKETSYRVFFVDENGTKISNEQMYKADRKDADTSKRVFKLRFNLKNQKYDRYKKYYLVAYDMNNDLETLRQEMILDIAFADDFGFGF